MMDAVFKRGDSVQYRGGGPVMHVISASGNLCYCHWVDGFGALQQGTFEQRNLVHASAPEAGPAPMP